MKNIKVFISNYSIVNVKELESHYLVFYALKADIYIYFRIVISF